MKAKQTSEHESRIVLQVGSELRIKSNGDFVIIIQSSNSLEMMVRPTPF